MATLQLADLDFNNVSKITNLPNPTLDQHAATKAYVDSTVEGLNWKDSARVATQGNTSIASPGATIDGITMAANDRVLVRANTAQAENGIYIWNGAAVPMTRSLDANSMAELEAAVVSAEEGTSAGATYRQTTVNGTLGSSNIVWTNFGTAAGAASEAAAGIAEIATQGETDAGTDDARFVTPLKLASYSLRYRKFMATFGDGSATSYAHTHNFNTRDVVVEIVEATGLYRTVFADIQRTTVNQVTLVFSSPPASNSLRVTILA